MFMQSLSVKIYEDPSEAPNYRKDHPEVKGAMLVQANIVKNGTEEGHPTVDLVFVDDQGNQYMAMITARLLNMVQTVLNGEGAA